ncbi:MAG: winged helix-turn-helix domain-containing protein [Rhodospirillales bacterium]|nr:winged helix-turn-helix domain-containing protein [Rhodospirillales bacterium]
MIYAFATCTLDADRRELRRDGVPVAVEPQVFDLLLVLLATRERVVSRDELFDTVWSGRIVSESTLASRLNAARSAIGDTGAAQRLIRTLPRKGVRFVGEVQEIPPAPAATSPGAPPAAAPGASAATVTDSAAAAPVAWPPAQGAGLPGLVVLPFANLGGDPAQDDFADGITEEITTALSRLSGLFVIARNSAFAYKGKPTDVRSVGAQLGVGYVLEGSVRRSRTDLRITGHLVDAISGATLWSDRFEGALQEVFALQDRVAESVAAAIEPTLQSAEIERRERAAPTRLDAYDLLLRALGLIGTFTAESLTAALVCLDEALARDPLYAPAMAASAYCRAQMHFQGWARPDEAMAAAAERRAWQAVERAPNDGQVLWMAAFAIWNLAATERDRARALFRRALLVNPNAAMALTLAGWIEAMCGETAAGRAMVLRAQRLNPRDPRGWLMSGAMAVAALVDEDYPAALRWADLALGQNRRFAVALRVLAVACGQCGEPARAREAAEALLAIEPDFTVSGFLARIPMPLDRVARIYAAGLTEAGLPA